MSNKPFMNVDKETPTLVCICRIHERSILALKMSLSTKMLVSTDIRCDKRVKWKEKVLAAPKKKRIRENESLAKKHTKRKMLKFGDTPIMKKKRRYKNKRKPFDRLRRVCDTRLAYVYRCVLFFVSLS